MVIMTRDDDSNGNQGVLIRSSDFLRLAQYVEVLNEQPIEKFPPNIRSTIPSLLNSIEKLVSYHLPGGLDSVDDSDEIHYFIPQADFEKVDRILEHILKYETTSILDSELLRILSTINNIWMEYIEGERRPSHSMSQHLQGLINQLSTRQDEINSRAKSVIDDIKEQADSAAANIARHAQRQSNQLSIQAKDLQSELLSKIETTASNAKINIKDESSKLWRELTEEITLTVDSTLEKKQKEIHDRNERHAKLLLEKVESEVSNLTNKVNEQIQDFCVLNDALRRTLNFVASDALADTSIKQAKEEKATADSLRGWGVLWLIASIVLFLITFDYDKLVDENNVPQYTLILLRSFFLIVGITPGFYLLRESARHRTDERRYRQKGIQLATIDGYFAEFDESERNNVKKDLSKHYFHGAEHFVDSSSVDHVQSKYDKIFDKVASSKKFN
ncbi:hypothetical protein DUG81_05820 [Vibrio parahaemolyticus]|uniref:hypothetical protein n=1 Tax=Vibrio parahaemolyticus TaxID=670 RepID=UPI00165DAA9E|nr:hypothetical protein [Vibrio parahaemolyticus]EGR2691074.1 hypothetical protein [Vibrio parahaemolyticus]EGR2706694.1 hypothetical protein [Vibrio parahaemolyticus]